MRRYYAEPPIVATPLEQGQQSWFAVVVPAQRTNEITNPSLETATTGYTAGAGALARSTAQQYHGAYSAAYTPSAAVNDGFFYTLTSSVGLKAMSCKFLGQKGVPYAFTYGSAAPADLVAYTFIGTGRWQWVWVYYNETLVTTRRLNFRKNGSASVQTFYVDGVQIETLADASETVSTYIDGSLQGLLPNQSPPAYYWNGTPHASSSTRSGLTRAGGEVKPFSHYGFTLLSIVGLGLAAPQNVATEYARIDGGYPDYTRKPSRQFTLVGRFNAQAPAQLDYDRAGLSDLLDRDANALDQELVLRYQKLDERDQPISDAALIRAKYQGGLDGNTESLHQDAAPITFRQYLPSIVAEGSGGSALSVQLTVADADYIIKRSADGTWSALGTGITGTRVYAILVARSGRVYVGGQYTDAGGVANTNSIAYYDPTDSAWHAMGTGVTGGSTVYSLVEMPDGTIVAGGDYTAMGGVANTLRLASYNPATDTWSALSTGANGSVLTMTVRGGLLYLGGSFTSIGGVAATRLASWSGAAFSALSTGANSAVNHMITGKDGRIYFTGSFTSPGNRVYAWDPATAAFVALGSGLAGTGSALAFTPSGILYVAADSTAGYLLGWNGVVWSQVTTGFSGTGPVSMQALSDGTLWVGGSFAVSSLPALTDSIVKVSPAGPGGAAVLTPIGIDLPGSPGVYAIAQSDAGDLYLGYDTTGSAVTESVTTVTNPGSARSYPTVTIRGPSSGTAAVYQLVNTTTGKSVFFDYEINSGETATLVFTPDNLSFTSDMQGNIASFILPGSNTAEFFLNPGDNNISFMAGGSSVTAVIEWRPAYTRLDGLTT